MGAVFALAAGDPTEAPATAIASGLHITFAVATALMLTTLIISRTAVKCRSEPARDSGVSVNEEVG
jgi:hypothetical protein